VAEHPAEDDAPAGSASEQPALPAYLLPPAMRSAKIAPQWRSRLAAGSGMRITYRIFLVGGIPITIAAAIALAALMLLNEADRARSGAVLASTIYRNLLSARMARDDFLDGTPGERPVNYERFLGFAEQARFDLIRLNAVVRDPDHARAARQASQGLTGYVDHMRQLVEVTIRNDGLVSEMNDRAAELIRMTDEARDRQHQSNADIVMSLTESDRKLRHARAIVDRTQELTAVIASVELLRARSALAPIANPTTELRFEIARMGSAEAELATALRDAGHSDAADELASRYKAYEASISLPSDARLGERASVAARQVKALAAWLERLLKVYGSEQGALHDQVAELLTYSVQAGETEQATQNIAIEALKLGSRTSQLFASRDALGAHEIVEQSGNLSETVASLPISPVIQTEMIDAIDQWRNRLSTTVQGLAEQNLIVTRMDATDSRMIESARFLDAMLTRNAGRIGELVRNILIFGAASGLLLGSITGIAVARSITRPLKRLQSRMMELAANSQAGPIAGFDRRDELGDMARATNVFVTEIGRRERALRRSKDRADAALEELQRTQRELIQAEKLASLGQLVAGVAHEINTPLGIALTTATLLGDESKRFGEAAASGRLQRSVLDRFVERMREGTQLLYSNLTRAANLVHSFKQVAADQASGERRRFDMDEWLRDLMTSLSPVIRKAKHEILVECPPGIAIDSYPGALGQVLTNLLVNAVTHAYRDGESGRITVRVTEPRDDTVRILFGDDGKGIPPEHIGKVFDPFFTTGRSGGSTGLGLHIVYNLVTSRLQGHIRLDSRLGAGTRFTIDIPKAVSEAAGEAAPEQPLQLERA
jgi:signal transduction histidine kinase